MTGTYAGQFVLEGFYNIKMILWQRTLLTRAIALVPALTVTIALQVCLNEYVCVYLCAFAAIRVCLWDVYDCASPARMYTRRGYADFRSISHA